MITVVGAKYTMEDLLRMETRTPENAGRRWRPIPHAELASTIRDECLTRGWRIKEERYATARDNADLAGAFLIEGVRGVTVPDGQTLSIGFLHSNARRRALKITVGSSVFVCNNGMCSGSFLLTRVHDHTVNLIDEVGGALDNYVAAAGRLADGVRALRERPLTRAEASDILLQAGRKKLIGWAAVGRVDAEYRHPTFADHGHDNSWALLNAFTYAARGNISPVEQMSTYDEFRKLLPVAALN